ncbi:MAG: TonB-dependent receptor [Gemmatimonadota bacterium]|nr:TonB-dependent receptor [Gemmatimonadota bacterium]MDH3422914.1 TonB-dependent receptor [Gemmatimonadota bacterium]
MASNVVRLFSSTVPKLGLIAGLAIALAGFGLPTEAQAQTGQIVGTVTNAATGAPLGEVQVFVEAQDLGALTRANGRFIVLNVPAGTWDVTAQRIGFGDVTQSVTVAVGGTATVDFALSTQALGLDEIVVTGTAGASTRREMGSTIAQINVGDLPDEPTQVSDMLQATAPGLDVYGGGAAGQGKVIRLRGANSAVLSEAPIIYVDGVRIRSTSLPDANPPDRRGGRSGNISVSPLDQINPNDIERIEVIKGSAATTLYGTEAAGGVIQVFTKRGVGGAAVWTAEVGTGTEWSRKFGVPEQGAPYAFMDDFLCTGILSCGRLANQTYMQNYALSVRGGTGGVDYFVSGAFNDGQGLLPNDHSTSYSTRANLTFSPAEDLQVQWNTSFTQLELTNTAQQNNAQALPLNAFRQERNYFATGDADVLAVLLDQEINEDVARFTTGATLTYSPLANLTNRFVAGYDWTAREHRNLRPFGWEQVPEGALLNNTFQSRVLTLDYVGSYVFDLSSDIASTFSWGGQAVGDDIREIEGFGENFPGAALPTISSAATRQAFENRQKIWNAGFFFQNVLDVSNKYFLTLGLRVDGNSAFGSGFGLQAYPKASASWVVSDEEFYPGWGELKFRAALGQSGRAPGAFDAVRTWSPEGLAGIPAFVPSNVGNDNIGPEVTTEIEGGFDASWLNSRLSTSFTYYHQTTAEALFFVPQLPSGGFSSSQLTNIGKIQNKGIEAQIDATVFQSSDWSVDLGVNISTNDSEILELNDASLESGCFKVGYPLRAQCNQKVANPDQLVSSFSEVEFVEPGDPDFQGDGTSASQYLYGPNLPTTFISPSITVRTPGGIQLSARGDYKGGFYMNEQVFPIGRSVRSPICYPYYVDPDNSIAVKDPIPAIWMARCGNTSQQEGYMWDASFFKLRSVSASIPMNAVFGDRVSNSVLTVALLNSFLWMKEMPFMDPETSADPGSPDGPQQGYDFEETVPAPISLRLSLRVTF